MKKISLIVLAATVFFVSFTSFAEADDVNGAMIKEASIRNDIVLAIENAKLYHNYLLAVGANEDKIAGNLGFIKATEDCLNKNTGDYCYFATKKIIAENPYYSGKRPIPKKKR